MGKKQKTSIITDNTTECIVCGRPNVDVHHCFGGSYRQISDKWGCVVPLCREHHTGPQGVHFNKELDIQIKTLATKRFKEVYGKDVIEVFGKNFI